LISGSSVAAETLYRWVDETGQVTYQGQAPIKESFTREEIKSASGDIDQAGIQNATVIFYAVENCKACDLARRDLKIRKIKFSEINPELDSAAGKSLIERFGKVEVPLIMVGDAAVKGYNPVWLQTALEKARIVSPTKDTAGP